MANMKVDTKKLSECGNDIMKLSSELNEVLFSLYERINKMPITTCEWTGNAAVDFVSKLNIEKKYYLALKDNIYRYGKILYESAYNIEQAYKELKND